MSKSSYGFLKIRLFLPTIFSSGQKGNSKEMPDLGIWVPVG